ncbi:MAG: GntR family transcriptional repressor for pyruvate dehydrogenase complex [Pseudohongiellaceae bacterium]|jgi:GntR family transcriptional repressor for pyruvate dehydrogenase complex
MPLSPSIAHEIADALRTDILSGRYQPQDRIPSERDLASRFNASRGAVREGFSQLEQLGLIRILPGGARVQAVEDASLAILGPLLELDPVPDPELVDQFLETMGALASLTVKAAVTKATPAQLTHLQQRVEALAKSSTDFESMQPQWREFLLYMADIADNLVVRLISNDLRSQFLEHLMNLGIKPEFKQRAVAKTLNALGESLAARDSEMAAAAIQSHFDDIREAAMAAINNKLAVLNRKVG